MNSRQYVIAAGVWGLSLVAGQYPAMAQVIAPMPVIARPVMAPTARSVAPAPVVRHADFHIDSIELGFERGIGPAVGRTVTYHRKLYEVMDVATRGGGPAFSGGSHFTIAPAGGALDVGLKAVAPDQVAGLPTAGGISPN